MTLQVYHAALEIRQDIGELLDSDNAVDLVVGSEERLISVLAPDEPAIKLSFLGPLQECHIPALRLQGHEHTALYLQEKVQLSFHHIGQWPEDGINLLVGKES